MSTPAHVACRTWSATHVGTGHAAFGHAAAACGLVDLRHDGVHNALQLLLLGLQRERDRERERERERLGRTGPVGPPKGTTCEASSWVSRETATSAKGTVGPYMKGTTMVPPGYFSQLRWPFWSRIPT